MAFLAFGLEQCRAVGRGAAVLHFVPYLGPAVIALGAAIAASCRSARCHALLWRASSAVSGAIGIRLHDLAAKPLRAVNAAVLFISLLFFGWLWGVWGCCWARRWSRC